jgi:hypothetical protein
VPSKSKGFPRGFEKRSAGKREVAQAFPVLYSINCVLICIGSRSQTNDMDVRPALAMSRFINGPDYVSLTNCLAPP